MKHILPLHTATRNIAYETHLSLFNLNFPQRMAPVTVNEFLLKPYFTDTLAGLQRWYICAPLGKNMLRFNPS